LVDKLTSLGVKASVSIKLVCFPVKIEGSASFKGLKSTYKDSNSTDCHAEYTTGASKLLHNQVEADIGMIDKIKECGGTHVVTSIKYGARCNIHFEDSIEKVVS